MQILAANNVQYKNTTCQERFLTLKYSKLKSLRKLITFVSGYWMIYNLLKLEQIYNSILCNTMVLLSTIIIVSNNGRGHTHRLQANPWHREKEHKVDIIQALTIHYIFIFQVPFFPFSVNKLCSDKTKICLDIGPAY